MFSGSVKKTNYSNSDHSIRYSPIKDEDDFAESHLFLPRQKKGNTKLVWKFIFSAFLVSMILSLFAYFIVTSGSARSASNDAYFGRLPRNVIPVHYNLTVFTDLDNFKFSGLVNIDLLLEDDATSIVFHAGENLIIDQVNLYMKLTGAEIEFAYEKETKASDRDLYTLRLGSTFKRMKNNIGSSQSQAILSIKYHADLKEDLNGYYKSSYLDADKRTRWLATTHFEPSDARKAFPCMDEPDLKASFSITLGRKDGLQALSNGIEKRTWKDSARKMIMTEFDTTPRMSTYLVAFVVGPVEYVEAYTSATATKSGLRVRVYTPIGSKKLGEYALEKACEIISFFEVLYGYPFPLPKMDLIAIPDFAMGAMENWGLITFRETALLLNPELGNVNSAKQRIVTVVAHELAHQWFGNLVTMKWWNDLWLNEGFATFMEYFGANVTEPGMNLFDQEVSVEMTKALDYDQSFFSHAIVIDGEVEESKVPDLFDSISYSKGAMIIRMIRDFVNKRIPSHDPEAVDYFFSRIKYHLDKFKYSNAKSNDLMESLEGDNHELQLVSLLKGWIGNVGHPVIQVNSGEIISQKFGNKVDLETLLHSLEKFQYLNRKDHLAEFQEFGKINVSQTRYLAIPYDRERHEKSISAIPSLGDLFPLEPEDVNKLWSVPVSVDCFKNDGKSWKLAKTINIIMKEPSHIIDFTKESCNYVRLNGESTGFYRTLYSPQWYLETSRLIAMQLGQQKNIHDDIVFFSVNDRSMFVYQVFGYFLDGRLDSATCLDALNFLSVEDDYNVWRVVLGSLAVIRERYHKSLKKFDMAVVQIMRPIVGKVLDRLLVDRQTGLLDHSEVLLRAMILEAGVSYGDADCINYFEALWARFKGDKGMDGIVESYEEAAMYLTAVKYTGDFDTVLAMYREASVSQVKVQLLKALSRVSSKSKNFKTLLEYTLLATETTPIVRTQDLYILMTGMCRDSALTVTQFMLSGCREGGKSDFFQKNYLDRSNSIAFDRIIGSCMRFGIFKSSSSTSSKSSSSSKMVAAKNIVTTKDPECLASSKCWIEFWTLYRDHPNFPGLQRTIMMINEKLVD